MQSGLESWSFERKHQKYAIHSIIKIHCANQKHNHGSHVACRPLVCSLLWAAFWSFPVVWILSFHGSSHSPSGPFWQIKNHCFQIMFLLSSPPNIQFLVQTNCANISSDVSASEQSRGPAWAYRLKSLLPEIRRGTPGLVLVLESTQSQNPLQVPFLPLRILARLTYVL